MAKYNKLDVVGSNEAKIEFATAEVTTDTFQVKSSVDGANISTIGLASTAPTPEDKNKGRCLQGRPTPLENAVGERLATEGLAAKVEEGWVRGYKWHQFYKV